MKITKTINTPFQKKVIYYLFSEFRFHRKIAEITNNKNKYNIEWQILNKQKYHNAAIISTILTLVKSDMAALLLLVCLYSTVVTLL